MTTPYAHKPLHRLAFASLICWVLALSAALPAQAQSGAPSGGSGGSGGSSGLGGSRRSGDDGSISSRIERNREQVRAEPLPKRLDDLRRRLAITPEQTRAWDDLRTALLEFTPTRPSSVSASEIMGAPQVAQQQLSAATNIYALTERMADMVKALYGKLSPGQQRTADDELPAFIAEVVSTNLNAWPRPLVLN
ncbi:MAG: Spy/CpxP family protein refolding chaperone [Ramlibacter sp.]|nr:Spy/CpxP family protein refolding chaperone [Ramlibacter sp.]